MANKKPRRANLRQYIVYLHKTQDQQLIEHMEPYLESHRANAEFRRLLYAGLNGEQTTVKTAPIEAVASRPRIVPAEPPFSVERPRVEASSSKAKARAFFGSFNDEE